MTRCASDKSDIRPLLPLHSAFSIKFSAASITFRTILLTSHFKIPSSDSFTFDPFLTDAENASLYMKCNHPHGHGHNYKVEITLKGPVDPVTGMVINITDLKKYSQDAIMSILDHKNIDMDVPYFKSHVSSMENISVFIWERMKEKVGSLLYEIKVHETDKNVAWYRGEEA